MIIRQLPRLTFRIDNSAEEGEAMSRRIDEVMRSDAEALAGETGEPSEADGNASETHDN